MDRNTYEAYVARALRDPDDPGISPLFAAWRAVAPKQTRRERDADMSALQLSILHRTEEIQREIDRLNAMADWYHEQAEAASVKAADVVRRAGINAALIENIDDIRDREELTGCFDRGRALNLLRSAGESPDENISNEDLNTMLERKKREALEENNQLAKEYDFWFKRQKQYEGREKELRTAAKRLEQEKNEITNDAFLSDEEKEQQLKVLGERGAYAVTSEEVKTKGDQAQTEGAAKLEEKAAMNNSVSKASALFDAP